jgi:hypothetical protein
MIGENVELNELISWHWQSLPFPNVRASLRHQDQSVKQQADVLIEDCRAK